MRASTALAASVLLLGLVAGCSSKPADEAAAASTAAAGAPAAQAAAAHATSPEAMPAGMPPGHPDPTADAKVTEPIPPAPGGVTVAKIWADRASLTGKRVTVRGKVVKFLGGIMGLNWVHIQDGTGSAQDATHDLTVTTSEDARVGDIVTVTGTVVTDKDFGAGYAYKVMLQGATIVVK